MFLSLLKIVQFRRIKSFFFLWMSSISDLTTIKLDKQKYPPLARPRKFCSPYFLFVYLFYEMLCKWLQYATPEYIELNLKNISINKTKFRSSGIPKNALPYMPRKHLGHEPFWDIMSQKITDTSRQTLTPQALSNKINAGRKVLKFMTNQQPHQNTKVALCFVINMKYS